MHYNLDKGLKGSLGIFLNFLLHFRVQLITLKYHDAALVIEMVTWKREQNEYVWSLTKNCLQPQIDLWRFAANFDHWSAYILETIFHIWMKSNSPKTCKWLKTFTAWCSWNRSLCSSSLLRDMDIIAFLRSWPSLLPNEDEEWFCTNNYGTLSRRPPFEPWIPFGKFMSCLTYTERKYCSGDPVNQSLKRRRLIEKPSKHFPISFLQ